MNSDQLRHYERLKADLKNLKEQFRNGNISVSEAQALLSEIYQEYTNGEESNEDIPDPFLSLIYSHLQPD